jgi:hypothetical protein
MDGRASGGGSVNARAEDVLALLADGAADEAVRELVAAQLEGYRFTFGPNAAGVTVTAVAP